MNNQLQTNRILIIDLLKSLGIIAVIIPHHLSWFFIDYTTGTLRYPEAHQLFYVFFTIISLFIFQLPIVAGTAFFLSVRKKSLSWGNVLVRAFLLAGACFLLNALTWGLTWKQDIFAWDILGFIAVSMVVSYPLIRSPFQKMNQALLLSLGIIAIVLSDKFPFSSQENAYWYKIFIGDLRGENYWPLCPWFSLFVLGIFLGNFFISGKKTSKYFLLFGGLLFIMATIVDLEGPSSFIFGFPRHFSNVWGQFLFKPYPQVPLGILGISLVFILLIHLLLNHLKFLRKTIINSDLLYYGQGILWVYLVTYLTGYHLTQWTINHLPMTFNQALVALSALMIINLGIGFLVGKLAGCFKKISYGSS